jgi:hypothetical protein
MRKPIITIIALLTLIPAAAIDAQAQATGNDKTVKCRFRLYGWDEPISDLNYNLKGKDAGLIVYQDSRSIFYDYSGPAVLTLYRIKTDQDGKILREPAAQADLTNGGSWPLIVISTHKPTPGRFQTMVLKDDLKSFPPGSYAFSNFTSVPVGGYLGNESFLLKPSENKLMAGIPKENGTTIAALFFKIVEGRKEPIYTNNWAIRPALRTRVFVRASPESPAGIVARRLVESTTFPPEPNEVLSKSD